MRHSLNGREKSINSDDTDQPSPRGEKPIKLDSSVLLALM